MGTADLRSAFSDAAPGFSCTQALLGYERHDGAEWQRLTFRGIGPDGAAFEVKSDLLAAHTNLEAAARTVAAQLAAKPEPEP